MGAFEHEVAEVVCDRFGSIAELARVTNLKQTTLYSLFDRGSFSKARHETVTAIANALEVDAAWLEKGKLVHNSTRFKGFVEVPLFGSISAGQPIEPGETDDRFPIHKELADRYPGSFLLKVSGTSMNRILPDGCYALIEPCSDVERDGQPYVVFVGGAAATVKRVRVLGNGIELVPDSTDPTWRATVYDYGNEGVEEVTVVGRVVTYYLPINWTFS